MEFIYKALWLLQFSFLQSFYFTLHKCILALMNYGVGWEQNGEAWFLKLLNSYLKKNNIQPVIFDVWANIGQYVHELSNYLSGTKKQIYCFEPMKKTFEILNQNITDISHEQIITINTWLWSEEKNISLFFNADDTADSCASVHENNISTFVSKHTNKETITITTIDSFCKSHWIDHIHFLKIDIEWNEMDCLQWAKEMINKWRIDIIQFEHNRCAIASKTFLKDYWDMFSENYDFYRQLSWNHWLYKISTYDIYLENFTYINYILVKKTIPFLV